MIFKRLAKKNILLVGIILVLIIVWLGIRFVIGGPEDDWICSNGQWVKHGNPRAPKPINDCGEQGQNSQIANPASVYCEEQGGRSQIRTRSDGSQYGTCHFLDGRACEEWEFFRTKKCSFVPSPLPGRLSYEEAKMVAGDTVLNSPTYKFDGFDLKYESFQIFKCPGCYEFTFSFKSHHAGYGNRTDQVLAQVITPHKIVVGFMEDKVSKIITDGKYDELKRKLLE